MNGSESGDGRSSYRYRCPRAGIGGDTHTRTPSSARRAGTQARCAINVGPEDEHGELFRYACLARKSLSMNINIDFAWIRECRISNDHSADEFRFGLARHFNHRKRNVTRRDDRARYEALLTWPYFRCLASSYGTNSFSVSAQSTRIVPWPHIRDCLAEPHQRCIARLVHRLLNFPEEQG